MLRMPPIGTMTEWTMSSVDRAAFDRLRERAVISDAAGASLALQPGSSFVVMLEKRSHEASTNGGTHP